MLSSGYRFFGQTVRKLLFIISITGFSPGLVGAEANSVSAVELFRVSGLVHQLEQIPIAIEAGFDLSPDSAQEGGALSAQSNAEIRSALVTAFAPTELGNTIIDVFRNELSYQELSAAIIWHGSPLGKKTSAVEVARSIMTTDELKRSFHSTLRTQPPGEDRLQAAIALRDAWKLTEASVDMMIDMQVAVTMAMVASENQDRQNQLLELQNVYEKQRAKLHDFYDGQNLMAVLYVYQDLTVSEMESYGSFLTSRAGIQYVRAVNLALRRAMVEGSLRLGRAVADIRAASSFGQTL